MCFFITRFGSGYRTTYPDTVSSPRTVFLPLWLFHVVVARGRFSMPAPSMPHGRQWAPCHSVIATPLLVAFELLLCIHLGSSY
ncbi:baculoviral IAP repeat-containing protein, partial [Trifolium medium]|nr:baculoviral IAP repeat-containing protein [Trifolium medium]